MKTLFALAVPGLIVCTGKAQSTEPDLKARLVDKDLYLRGLWQKGSLKFDVLGNPTSSYKQGSLGLSGVHIRQVEWKNDKLLLRGERLGLKFLPTFSLVPLAEKIDIEITGRPGTEFGPALDKIFAVNLTDLTPSAPYLWRDYMNKKYPNSATQLQSGVDALHASPEISSTPNAQRSGISVTTSQVITGVPILVRKDQPEYTDEARRIMYSHIAVTLGVVVEKDETASHIQILDPVGMGLDEEAALSLDHAEFKPATMGGAPIRIAVGTKVYFELLPPKPAH